MIEIYKGDIFKAPIDIIIHQANCMCVMGAGIAKKIKQIYPRAYEVDQMTKKGDHKKLGQFTVAMANEDQDKYIFNMYGQYGYGRDKQYTNYIAVAQGLKNILYWLNKAKMQGKRIGIPYKMGCNNGGAEWNIIEGLIRTTFEDSSYNVLICQQ